MGTSMQPWLCPNSWAKEILMPQLLNRWDCSCALPLWILISNDLPCFCDQRKYIYDGT